MTQHVPADDYEELVRALMGQLASVQDVTTGRLDRPTERLEGLTGTRHQIDVLWDFTDSDGSEWRILFEARSYGTRLKQSAVFAFDGVVQDIGALSARNCVGVMVTTTGYQRGAKTVGDSRGVLLLELRAPNDGDFKNRLERVTVTAKVRQPFLDNVQVQLYGGTGHGSLLGFVGLEQPGWDTFADRSNPARRRIGSVRRTTRWSPPSRAALWPRSLSDL